MFKHKSKSQKGSFSFLENKKLYANTIVSENIKIDLDTHKTFLNNNIFALGGSGNHFTDALIKPNLLQANASYFLLVSKDKTYDEYADFLLKKGYDIVCIDFDNPNMLTRFNPLFHIVDTTNVVDLAECLFQNTKPSYDLSTFKDISPESIERRLFTLMCLYASNHTSVTNCNFQYIISVLNDKNFFSKLNNLIRAVETTNPDTLISNIYKEFVDCCKIIPQKKHLIVESLINRLSVFNENNMKQITGSSSIDIKNIYENKTAVFCFVPEKYEYKRKYSILYSMLFQCMKNELYGCYDEVINGKRLLNQRIPIRFFLTNTEYFSIPDFSKTMATCRIPGLSICVAVENFPLFKERYPYWETIIGNCDTHIFYNQKYQKSVDFAKLFLSGGFFLNNLSLERTKSTRSYDDDYVSLVSATAQPTIYNDCIIKIRGLNNPILDIKYDYKQHSNNFE